MISVCLTIYAKDLKFQSSPRQSGLLEAWENLETGRW